MEQFLCGVDLGGTKLSVGLVSLQGQVLESETVYDHVHQTPDQIVARIVALIGSVCARRRVAVASLAGIGVGTAGHIRYRDGTVITMSNLEGFAGYPLRQRLQDRVSVPVALDNDANAQAFAEYKFGRGRGADPFLFMTVSTQIGAGIVLGGQIFRGRTGTAGEFGHTILDPDSDEVCPCGNRGCLIALASGVAIPSSFRRQLARGLASPLALSEPQAAATPDGPFILKGLALGDPACQGVVDEFARRLGTGLYNLFQIFNPAAIVIGGGLTNWGEALFRPMTSTFRTLAGTMMFDEVALVPGTVENSGVVGAALMAQP